MKKLLLLLLLIPLNVYALSAEAYVVMDYDTGRVLIGENISKEKLIASTTKIMTAIIALENGDLASYRTVGDEVLKAYGSAIYLEVNEVISLEDLLYGLILRSGNDAAIEIAYHISGSLEEFVNLMNDKAYEIGMSNTIFYNPHGLEESDGSGNTSTAYDMALLMRYALNNEKFREIIHTSTYKATSSGKTYVWQNKNKLLSSYEYTIGGKTGYTEKARRTLVTAASKDDKTVIVATLNDGDDFSDHEYLYELVFSKYERYLLIDENTFINDNYYLKDSFYALLTEEEYDSINIEYKITNSLESEVGVAEIYLSDDLIGSVKIYQYVEEEAQEGFWTKFLRWLFGW